MRIAVHVKCPLLLSGLMKQEISKDFLKNARIPNFMKVSPLGADLFFVNGQTDRQARQSSAFRSFAKELEKVILTFC